MLIFRYIPTDNMYRKEDTKGIIRSRKLKGKQCNGQKKKDKDLQNIQKTKDRAPYVTPVV